MIPYNFAIEKKLFLDVNFYTKNKKVLPMLLCKQYLGDFILSKRKNKVREIMTLENVMQIIKTK